MGREEGAEPGEFYGIELPGPDLDGKDRIHLHQRQASDEQFGSRFADHPIHDVGASLYVIVLDQGACVQKLRGIKSVPLFPLR